MMFEIVKLDGLYCVFKRENIIAAFESKKEAEEAVKGYKRKEKESRTVSEWK